MPNRPPPSLPLLALAAAALALAGCATKAATPVPTAPPAAARSAPVAPRTWATPEEALPGIPFGDLTDGQKLVAALFAQEEFCYCGSPHTVAERLHQPDGGCVHAKRMARLAVKLAGAGLAPAELSAKVAAYYASFEPRQRASIEVEGWGPPLGDAAAPIAVVEFSDFTCPFCQLLRPQLEQFVKERASRLRLYYKPFPIESHPNAVEAAQAGEWARANGFFWPMHDLLFSPGSHEVESLADLARTLGQDPTSLREALGDGRYLARVHRSQAEARAAGLRATPTLYVEGRRLILGDLSDWMLEFTLQDEEEWKANRGWARDATP